MEEEQKEESKGKEGKKEGKKQTKETQACEETLISLNFDLYFEFVSKIFYA